MIRFIPIPFFFMASVLLGASLQPTPQLIKGWGQVENPDGTCQISAHNGQVTFTLPGPNHDLWPVGGKVNAPRILHEVEGNFTVEVKVASSVKPENGFFRAGTLLIWQDEMNMIRLDSACAHRGRQTHDFFCYLHVFKDGRRLVNEQLRPLKEQPTNLRLTRRDTRIVASFSQDDGQTWKTFREKRLELPQKLKVGVAALNVTKSPFTISFQDFKISK